MVKAQLPPVIRNLLNRCTQTTLQDGTVSYFFVGILPANMKREIIKAKSAMHPTATVYIGRGEDFDWSARFGTTKSTQHTVHFSFNDYTVPATAARLNK